MSTLGISSQFYVLALVVMIWDKPVESGSRQHKFPSITRFIQPLRKIFRKASSPRCVIKLKS